MAVEIAIVRDGSPDRIDPGSSGGKACPRRSSRPCQAFMDESRHRDGADDAAVKIAFALKRRGLCAAPRCLRNEVERNVFIRRILTDNRQRANKPCFRVQCDVTYDRSTIFGLNGNGRKRERSCRAHEVCSTANKAQALPFSECCGRCGSKRCPVIRYTIADRIKILRGQPLSSLPHQITRARANALLFEYDCRRPSTGRIRVSKECLRAGYAAQFAV